MAVSVHTDPLLEKKVAQAAQRQGMSKSRFIIAAVERALGCKNPYRLMATLQREGNRHGGPAVNAVGREQADDVAASKAALHARLKIEHDGSEAG